MMEITPHTLIIGIDGINLDLINRLLPRTTLPTINSLKETCLYGDLRSVIPTHSASAWASFFTGQTPAGHGVFDFKNRLPDGRYRHAKPDFKNTFWHQLGEHGYRVGVYNFPITYPPEHINGWMVSGMLSSDLNKFAYPEELNKVILKNFPEYILDIEWVLYEDKPDKLIQDLTLMVDQRGQVGRFLLENYPVHCFAFAIIASDRALHPLWRFLDPHHPAYDHDQAHKLQPAIYELFFTIDNVLANILQTVKNDPNLILLSDHGFHQSFWQFNVNSWLESNGWLVSEGSTRNFVSWIRNIETPKIRNLRRQILPDMSRHVSAFSPSGTVKWQKTVAFCPWTFNQGIRLNVKGRESHGIVSPGQEFENLRDEISDALLSMRNPATGAAVISLVEKTEQVYSGNYINKMPDLIFDVQPGYAIGTHRHQLFEHTGWVSGDHNLEGFVLIKSKEKTASKLVDARLIDIAPSILSTFGIQTPNYMDGKPLGIYSSMNNSPTALPSSSKDNSIDLIPVDDLSTEEEEDLLNQLRNLGYM